MSKRSYDIAFQNPVDARTVHGKKTMHAICYDAKPHALADGFQHAAAGSAHKSVDSGVNQPTHPICDVSQPQTLADTLVKRVLEKLKEVVTKKLSSACHGKDDSLHHGVQLHHDLQLDIGITKLHLAYARFLHDTFHQEWSSDSKQRFMNVTAGMVRKLRVISETAAYEGNRVMHKMLEHRWLEYKWSTIVKILQCAMDYAGVQKARARRKLKNCEENLLKMRTSETRITYTG